MKKSSVKKSITQLSKVLKSDEAQAAIAVLRREAELLPDEKKASELSKSDFEIADQIKGQEFALAIYSDGACRGNPGPGSYAFIVQDCNGEILNSDAKAFDNTTNNRMELSGAIAGLESLDVTPMHSIHVFTDSKYMVDGMNSWIHGWKKRGWKKADKKTPENVDLWQKLDALAARTNTTFHWVKGHAGHPQNEYVDQLANDVLDLNGH